MLLGSLILTVPPPPTTRTANWKPPGSCIPHCFRPGGNHQGEVHQDVLLSLNSETKEKHNDIWQLFSEAQKNILYLNKQRIVAMEELDSLKKEKDELLDRIQQLEAIKPVAARKGKLSISSELLLRIDSMVLSSLVGSKEASDLRRLVMQSKAAIAEDFSDITRMKDAKLLAKLRHFLNRNKTTGFHIVHICTEMDPVVSVGSLAQYVTGLSCALHREGNMVEVILPKYASLDLNEVQGLREVEAEFYSYFNGQLHENRIWTGVVYGIGVTFIQPIRYSSFFSQDKIYGYSNDFERFTYFSRASLDYIVRTGKQPDVLHIHNWETSIVGPLFWDVFVNQGLEGTRILLTCQGFASQCLEQPEKLALCGLDPSKLHRSDRLQDNNKAHLVNVLKGGVVYSNKVIVMSSMHSKGKIIHTLGHGLESTLAIHKDKLLVAPYGLDISIWDPCVDVFLPQNFNSDSLKGKSVCKISLQQHLGLPQHASMIIVGCFLSDGSNVDLDSLKALVWMASSKGVQFIFMGLSVNEDINRAIERLKEEFVDDSVRFMNKYDEALSHLIFAGSDIILCSSFDDPAFQTPLKAIRYGAVPVALNFADRRFRQFSDNDSVSSQFSEYINNTFANMSLSQAIDEFKNNQSEWVRKIRDAMEMDFSWDAECCDVHISAYADIKNL